MKKIITFLAFVLSLPLFGQTEKTTDHSHAICKDLSSIIEMEAHHHEQLVGFRSNELTSNYDLKYHRLEWEVDPAVFYIKGSITSYFVPKETDFQQINFDLSAMMTVNQISYHGNSLSYTLSGDDNLQIELPAVIPAGTLDSITINYEGVPTASGFGAFATSTHNGTPVMWTLSEPYGAKQWWPCKQDLNDKIDSIDVIVRTPEDFRVASNGLLISEVQDGRDKIFHWKHRYAIPAYLIAIAITDYAVYSDYVTLDNGDSIEVLNYVYPESLASAQSQTQSIIEIMGLFNDLFGTYPFADEKYGHAQFGWGGGMEHQTMSFMGSFSYGLQAHELAHQWFGDKVTCGSWEDIWLNEGFATYLTGLTNEFLGSSTTWHDWKQNRINSITSNPGGSVWVNDTTSIGRIFSGRLSYNKGAMLLHMLRWKLGDEAFFQALKNYLNDPKLAFGYAKTTDLQKHLESQSGQDLSEFFQDWFYKEGFPSYQVIWSNTSTGIVIRLGQTTSHNSVDFFEMPVPIYVEGEGQDSILRLEHAFSNQVFEIELPFEVASLSFDPDLWLISKDNTIDFTVTSIEEIEQLKNSILISPNPLVDYLNISIQSPDATMDKVEITDVAGKQMVTFNAPQDQVSVDVQHWAKGVYMIRILSDGIWLSQKVVKQ